MALTPLEGINRVMADRVADTRLTNMRLLANLASAGRVQDKRDTQLDWDADLGGADAAGDLVTNTTVQSAQSNIKPAKLTIGSHRIYHKFQINRVKVAEMATRAPEELSNLIGATVERGIIAILRKLNQHLYDGTGLAAQGGVIGLGAVLSQTGAYAGIDPTVVGQEAWKSIVLANAGTPRAFTRDLMLDFDEAIAIAETMYDGVVMHPSTVKKYKKIFDTLSPEISLVDRSEASGLKRADLGHGDVAWNGNPIIQDVHAPTDKIITMDMADVTLHCYRLDGQAPDPEKLVVNDSYGIPIHVAELPSNNSVLREFEMYVLPQLQVFNRKRVQAITDLS